MYFCGRYIRAMRWRMSAAGAPGRPPSALRAGRGGSRHRSPSGRGRAARASAPPRSARAARISAGSIWGRGVSSPAVRKITRAPVRAVRLISRPQGRDLRPAHPVLGVEQDVGVDGPRILAAQEVGEGDLLDARPAPTRSRSAVEVLRPQVGRQAQALAGVAAGRRPARRTSSPGSGSRRRGARPVLRSSVARLPPASALSASNWAGGMPRPK